MKKRSRAIFTFVTAVILAAVTVFTAGFQSSEAYGKTDDEVTGTDTVSVVFTHDMHSHMDTDRVQKKGRIVEIGGFAKLKTAIDNVKAQYPDTFLLDAGDFSMGTPYQTIFSEEASEMKMMGFLGFEATTLGNHEFDYRAAGLASMMNAAAADDSTPAMLIANIDWEATLADEELRDDAQLLKDSFDSYGVKDYMIIEHNGIKAAVFGIIGESAVDYAPESGLLFKDPRETAAEVVEKIKADEDADIIICLSHSGTVENEKDTLEKTEDYLLAEEVPDIDLIISGHTHTVLGEAVKVGNSYIVSCGSYNRNAGHITLKRGDDGRYELASYELIPLDESIAGDSSVDEQLGYYRSLVDEKYFSGYGYSADQVLAYNDIDFPSIEQFGLKQGEEPFGDLIADSYKYAVNEATGETPDVTVVPHGVVRGSFLKGDITVTDAFNVSSLGYGKDGSAGYPLVKVYLTGRELKAVAEVDASISDFMGVARLYCAGLEYSWNPHRLILNRAVDVSFNDGEKTEEIQDDRLYSVVGDLYSCQMLGTVKSKSFGLLKIDPKDEDGELIDDFEEHIINDGDGELKAWYALASYIDSFEGDIVPDYYSTTHDRKTKIDSRDISDLLKQPNNVFALVSCVASALVILTVIIVIFVRRRRHRKAAAKDEA